jgi:predicted GTPase
MDRIRVIIMGAAGRDFHNFNVCFRDDPTREVVAFTATQIPGIHGRRYPPELAGPLYPGGIPIYQEDELFRLIARLDVREVIFAYSDVSYEYVMGRAAAVLAAGPDFRLLGPDSTLLRAKVPVVAVCAVRTGSGKSQTSARVAEVLRGWGKRVVLVRHPMPYGDLVAQAVQRYATLDDLDRYQTTIEEREEYEPHLRRGIIVYAGVDYARILAAAEAEADFIIWDGGNNDLPFFRPDLHIVVADPLRAGHELRYYPGETNLRMANVVVVNKVDSARPEQVATVVANTRAVNPLAVIVEATSPITIDRPSLVSGRRVVVVEDGPTVTHGEMGFGAGMVAATQLGATVVDPRPYVSGNLAAAYRKYPWLGDVVPALGYGAEQVAELERALNAVDADAIVAATPVDLTRLIHPNKPIVRVSYELREVSRPDLAEVLASRFGRH